jgi:hypothetical protein
MTRTVISHLVWGILFIVVVVLRRVSLVFLITRQPPVERSLLLLIFLTINGVYGRRGKTTSNKPAAGVVDSRKDPRDVWREFTAQLIITCWQRYMATLDDITFDNKVSYVQLGMNSSIRLLRYTSKLLIKDVQVAVGLGFNSQWLF